VERPVPRSGGRAGASRPADQTLRTVNAHEFISSRWTCARFFPGGGTRALYGRRDACRYEAGQRAAGEHG